MIYNRVGLWLLYGKRSQGPDSFLFVEVRILEVGKWNARMIIDQPMRRMGHCVLLYVL